MRKTNILSQTLYWGTAIVALLALLSGVQTTRASGPYTIDSDLNQTVDVHGADLDAAIRAIRPDSPLIGLGQAFVDVGRQQGINAIYIAAHAAWESAWGTSRIAADKNNLFGYGAYDHCPYSCALTFSTKEEGIAKAMARIKADYLTPGGRYYNGATLRGMNIRYATDSNWKNGIASIMNSLVAHMPAGSGQPPPIISEPNVNYEYRFDPTSESGVYAGRVVKIIVEAKDITNSHIVNSINVEVDGKTIGTISGSSGSLDWNTNGLTWGVHIIRFSAFINSWSGSVNTAQTDYTLVFIPPAPAPLSCNPLGCIPLEEPPLGSEYARLYPTVSKGKAGDGELCYGGVLDFFFRDWVAVYDRNASDAWQNAELSKFRIYSDDEEARKPIRESQFRGADGQHSSGQTIILCLSSGIPSLEQAKGVWLWNSGVLSTQPPNVSFVQIVAEIEKTA